MSTALFSKSKSLTGSSQPEVYVAAFGKHPAWNDFIDDPGLETERLIAVKRVLYLEGIAAAIDTGAWDKLEPAQRTEGFGHLVVWRTRTDIVVCRLWSSSDGKGRTKYPMVVLTQCKGAPLAWVLTEALPRLERLERRCREATTQEQVKAALEATRQELRARASVADGSGPINPGAVGEIADALSADGNRDAFHRLMYQVERDWGAHLSRRPDSTTTTRAWSGAVRAQHARVPTGPGALDQTLSRWMHCILNLVDPGTTVTLIRATDAQEPGAAWTDVIVGDPEGAQFFCIRASEQSLPLATSIPYTLEPDLIARCDRLIADSRLGRALADAPQVITREQTGLFQRVKNLLGGKKKGLLVLLIATALVGSGIAIVLLFSGSSGPGNGTIASKDPPPPIAQPPPTPVPAETGDWGKLCAAYNDWFAEFLQRLQKKPGVPAGATFKTRAEFYATDPYLKGLLDKAAGHPIDPWSIAGVPKSMDLQELAKNPPAALAQSGTQARIAEAMGVVEGFSVRLARDWPLLAALTDAAKSLEASGLRAEADFIRALVAGTDPHSPGGPAAGIDAVLAVGGTLGELQRRLAARDACIKLATGTGDAMLATFGPWALAQTGAAQGAAVDLTTLEELSRSLARLAEVTSPLQEFLATGWARTDTALLARRVGGTPAIKPGAPSRDGFLAWLELARQCPKLDPAQDPRRASPAAQLLEQAQATRRRLEDDLKAPPEKRLTDLQAAAKSALDEIATLPFDAETRPRIADALARAEAQLRELKQGLDNAVAVETAKRAGSAKEVRDGLTAQATIVARSESINTTWRAERDKLLAAISDADYAQLRVEADRLRQMLLKLDSAVAPGLDAGAGTGWSGTLASASWTIRERAVAAVLQKWGGLQADAQGTALNAAGELAGAQFTGQRKDLEALVADVGAIELLLKEGKGLSEAGAGGQTLGALAARCRGAAALREPAIDAAVRPILLEVESLERIEALATSSELVAAATASLPDRWATGLAAWRRLARMPAPGWPSTLKELQEEGALSARLLQAVAAHAGDRRTALEQEITAQRAARWAHAFARLSDAGEVEAAAALAEDFAVAPDKLSPVLRYDLALASLRRAVAGSLTDEQARDRAKRFEREVTALGAAVSGEASVAALLQRLGPISGRSEPEQPRVDLTRLGPGAVTGNAGGWKGQVDGQVLRFTRGGGGGGGGAETLEFLQFQLPGAGVFFLSATEMSLGRWIALADAADAWKEITALFPTTTAAEDLRKGPRVWRWAEDARRGSVMRPAEKWLRDLATGRNVPETPKNLNVPPPGLTHPMNYLPPAAALYVAQLAGCRLPTPAEWAAARAASEPQKNLARCNLRDQQFHAEQVYVSELAKTGTVNWPDTDAFVPARIGAKIKTGESGPCLASDDGVLWFAPVDRSDAGAPLHLFGNVAEYVVAANAAQLVAPPEGPSSAAARTLISRLRESLRVVGGSALSPIDLDPADPQRLDPDEATEGFADVGFRLAFSAEGVGPLVESLGVQLAKALADARYLKESRE